jgi:hypothetical protein
MTLQGNGSKRRSGVVDITFVIDATGSMAPCIEAVKKHVSALTREMSTPNANNAKGVIDYRVRTVGYRDCGEHDHPWIEENDFVSTPEELQSQLERLNADGGGDEPESLLECLYAVASAGASEKGAQVLEPRQWRYQSEALRVVIAFTDASYHEKMREPAGGSVDDVINALHEQRIHLCLFAPSMPCHDILAETDGSLYQPIGRTGEDPQAAMNAFVSDDDSFRETLKLLGNTISATASA